MNNPYLAQYKQQQLRACQLKQLAILEVIDGICRKHDIPYWLDGGTLLGAVRHGGFIPWDDDIDIAMRQEDMQRFADVAPQELPKGLILQTPQNQQDSTQPVAKVRYLNSFYVEPGDNMSAQYEKGIFVDIFPMTPYPPLPRKLVKRLTLGISKSYAILHKPHYYSLRSFGEFFWFGGKFLICRALWAVLSACFRNHTYISNILINNGYGITHHQDVVFPLGTITFEGKTFAAPANPDAYLKDIYHNYTDIPPVEKRVIHSIFLLPELIHDDTSF